jgi:hypothetical protein
MHVCFQLITHLSSGGAHYAQRHAAFLCGAQTPVAVSHHVGDVHVGTYCLAYPVGESIGIGEVISLGAEMDATLVSIHCYTCAM